MSVSELPRHTSWECPACGGRAFMLSAADATGRTATCLGCRTETLIADLGRAVPRPLPQPVKPQRR